MLWWACGEIYLGHPQSSKYEHLQKAMRLSVNLDSFSLFCYFLFRAELTHFNEHTILPYLNQNCDTHTLYIFSKSWVSFITFIFLLLMGKIHLDLSWLFSCKTELSNLRVGTFSHWLWWKKVVCLAAQVILQTGRFYLNLISCQGGLISFITTHSEIQKKKKIKYIYSHNWSDTAEGSLREKREMFFVVETRSASVIKALPLPSCTSEQAMFSLQISLGFSIHKVRALLFPNLSRILEWWLWFSISYMKNSKNETLFI